ncbi:MAG: SDR family oxidoreductase [Chitinophagaceae bacterium]|nr:MAG: SDR family oxidoreductase [Chitinophagaceae bacterium]
MYRLVTDKYFTMSQDFRYMNKTIVITGASSGAGRAMALELATSGAKLVLVARRAAALEELAIECEELGGLALAVTADVTDISSLQLVAENAAQFGGRIDVWINNAGVLAAGQLEDIPAEVNEKVVRTNLVGYMNAAQVVIPYFKRQGFGILVNNISIGGYIPVPYGAAYSASKFGLRGFSEALRGELKEWENIHVCDIFPGLLDTPGMHHAANYLGKDLKPIPPIYAPKQIAVRVADLLAHPRPKTLIGVAPRFMKLGALLFPGLTATITGSVIRRYLKTARDTEHTAGNILDPVNFGTSAEGGWQKHPRIIGRPSIPKVVLAATAITLLGLLLSGSRSKQSI